MNISFTFKAATIPTPRRDKRFRNDKMKPRFRRRFKPKFPSPRLKLR